MGGNNIEIGSENSKNDNHARSENRAGHDPQQVAAYVCEMTGNLKKLALDADLKFLAYLIDMAHIEAFTEMNSSRSD